MVIIPTANSRPYTVPSNQQVAPDPMRTETASKIGADLDEASQKILARVGQQSTEPPEPISRIVQLFRIADPRVRSRVALLVGQYTSYSTFLQNRLEEQDDRVRANVIESLWETKSEAIRSIYKGVLNDPYHRVRGNALLGLYRMGDPSAAPMLAKLSDHASALFRAAAAWAMGETKDLQFVDLLTRMGHDGDEGVRRNAFTALLKLNEHQIKAEDA